MYSLIWGTAFEVHPNDEIANHPNVRTYNASDGRVFIGDISLEISHVCDLDCATRLMTGQWMKTDNAFSYVDPYQRGDNFLTIDVVSFDPGDDPYICCACCGAELLRDDDAYESIFGSSINASN